MEKSHALFRSTWQRRFPEAILQSIIAENNLRSALLRGTIFVCEVLLRADSSEVRKTIAKCDDSTVRCWMKLI